MTWDWNDDCVFRGHLVPGLYRLTDLRRSPSPRLVSVLRGTLPVSWTNEVKICILIKLYNSPTHIKQRWKSVLFFIKLYIFYF